LPLKAAVAFNSVSQGFRAALSFNSTYFKTSFKVWKEYTDFGTIEATVGDKLSGRAIAGVLVTVLGDEDNPMHPAHEQTTDNSGFVRFENIGVGEKSLQATKAGYNAKTVGVTVEKNKTVSVDIVMEKQENSTGGVSGIVVNEIFSKARQDPMYATHDTLFNGQLFIYARGQVAGQPYEDSHAIYNGRYTFVTLPAGTFWIVAIHPDNDYAPDSLQVTSVENETHDAPRALRMSPKGTMSVEFYIDASSSPQRYDYPIVVASAPIPTTEGRTIMAIAGGVKDEQQLTFIINLGRVTGPDHYPIGPIEGHSSPSWNDGGYVQEYITALLKCQHDGGSYNMLFTVEGDPNNRGCDCGITDLGMLYITKWGTNIGDVIEGSFDCHLAGSKTCECNGIDDNHDYIPDRWDVVCQVLNFTDVKFRMVVGSVAILAPSSPQMKLESGQPLLFAPGEATTSH
ncbi:MAG: carboxypeptidase-like regulatory domain-containing protein, partial [candidate division Zixibacteria bacterium]|nr:carboxypeptidase-like regulatory domain-containing protein [candidate division Zixibacteria bacterium]